RIPRRTRTVVGERCPSSQTSLSTDCTSFRAFVSWNPTANARDLGNVCNVLRRDDPRDRSWTDQLAQTPRAWGRRTPRHQGKPYQPKSIRAELGSFPPSAERNRCKVATRLAAGCLAAPERTNHRAESSCPSRLVLLRPL